MKKLTKEQLEIVVDNMASDIILWQNQFNSVMGKLEALDGKKRLGVLIFDKERLIESYITRLNPE